MTRQPSVQVSLAGHVELPKNFRAWEINRKLEAWLKGRGIGTKSFLHQTAAEVAETKARRKRNR